MANDFRARLEGLTNEQLAANAPPIALILALTVELERIGVIAAAEHDTKIEEVTRARKRLAELRGEMLRANEAIPNSTTQRWIRRLQRALRIFSEATS